MNVPFKKKRLTPFIITIAVLSAAIILLSTRGAGSEESPDEPDIQYTPVKVIRAEKGDLSKTLRLNGYIQSDDVVTVIPFVSGTLERISVKLGDSVEKDQLIAKIDSRTYDLQLKQAEAAYLGAKSSFDRIEQMYKSNATTKQNYDQAKSQYDAYKSQYELAALQASYTEIRAPIGGTVLMIHANQGSIAAPEVPILTIGDLSSLIVKLNVPDKYYELFRTNSDMNVNIYRPHLKEQAVEAEIKNISPVISPESRNFEIECSLAGAVDVFRPGMFVYCVFKTESRNNVYYLPHSALGPGRTLWYVDHLNSTAERLDYPGGFSNDEFFTVPPETGDLDIIIEGQSFLTPGQPVKIK